jgi:hypothetical protein
MNTAPNTLALQHAQAAVMGGSLNLHAVVSADAANHRRRIDRGGTHWISRTQGRRVVCDAGLLCLRFEGQSQEVLLSPGEAHTCESAARLAVYALQEGSFHVV